MTTLSGNITESVGIVDWEVSAFRCDTGALLATQDATTSYNLDVGVYADPCTIVCCPKTGDTWLLSSAYSLNDYVIASDPDATPHLWQCTTAGTSAGTEPVWNLSGTTTDNTVTWTYVGPLVDAVALPPRLPV